MIFLIAILSLQAVEIAGKIPLTQSELTATSGMTVSLAEFRGPDGRLTESTPCDFMSPLVETKILFLKYSSPSSTKFRMVLLDNSGSLLSHSELFPSVNGVFSIETVCALNVFSDRKGVYLKLSQHSDLVSRTMELVFLFEDKLSPLFYNLLSKELFRDGGRDMKSILYLSHDCLCLAQSPEYWIMLEECHSFHDIEQCIWSIPGTIYFEPEFFGYSPKSYVHQNDSFSLRGKDLIFLFNLPNDDRFFPDKPWSLLPREKVAELLNVWSAFLGYNFSVSAASYTGFDPSFRIIGGISGSYLELLIYLQDGEIIPGKDLLSIFASNPFFPEIFFEISIFPQKDASDEFVSLETENYFGNTPIEAKILSQSETTTILLVEIPLDEMKKTLIIEGDIRTIPVLFKYRDVDEEKITFVSLPSNANPDRRDTWADLIFGDLTLKERR
ncbi:hypothetical protein JW890_05120 [candidate division WOR-3 bacterium]|nr:hypothetical protein [candidate division WOR-3 bacterium]